jgi:DNA polymerase III delta subunit
MLTVICGEDSVASFEYFNRLVNDYRSKNWQVQPLATALIPHLLTTAQEPGLFASEIIYTCERLNRSVARRKGDVMMEALTAISRDPTIHLLDWEEGVAAREVKLAAIATMKEFKPSNNVFQLLDACIPRNHLQFLSILNKVTNVKNEMLIYILLQRHVRSLVLTATTGSPGAVAPWARAKLYSQAKQWGSDSLIAFYSKLLDIDTSLKSGRNPYGIKKSLDILACYYLI